jgi:hypothetical protein
MNNGVLARLGTEKFRLKATEPDTFSLPITSLDPPSLPRRSKTTMQIADASTPNTDHSSIMSTSLLFAVFNSFWRTHAIIESRPNSKISKPNCFESVNCCVKNVLLHIVFGCKISENVDFFHVL